MPKVKMMGIPILCREASGWGRTIHRLGFDDAYAAMLRQALPEDFFEDRDTPLHVLDAGMGTGELSVALAKIRSEPFMLSGIDISTRMLDEAKRYLRRSGLS